MHLKIFFTDKNFFGRYTFQEHELDFAGKNDVRICFARLAKDRECVVHIDNMVASWETGEAFENKRLLIATYDIKNHPNWNVCEKEVVDFEKFKRKIYRKFDD